MTPTDRARYLAAYEAAYPFGLMGSTAGELDGAAEEMREVAEAADLAAAAAVLDDYEYGYGYGDSNRTAARAIRAYLGIVDPPDPDTVEALVQRWSAALAGLAEGPETYGPHDAEALCAATERLVERLATAERERDRLQAILDAERGVRGPEGWVYDRHGSGAWRRIDGAASVINPCRGVWSWRHGRLMEDAPTALDAMEAADAAVRGAE